MVVLDQTGYKESIDLDLKGDLTNINDLSRQLKAYGLSLQKSQEEIDMLIIRDKMN